MTSGGVETSKANTELRVVVVGGGTAGWITACLIAADYTRSCGKHYLQANNHHTRVRVTLIESPSVPSIGVGEGTWPSMRNTLQRIGICETQFLATCDASFKQGSCFRGWRTGHQADSYYHPFSVPEGYPQQDFSSDWAAFQAQVSFCNALSAQGRLCDLAKAPKTTATPAYNFALNYGYHLDAGKFAALLKSHGTEQLQIDYVSDEVVAVLTKTGGPKAPIAAIATEQNGHISGDLFVDCTGFNALLIGQHFQVPRTSLATPLLNDRAVAMQVPYHQQQADIASATIATAQSEGWIWDIGLPTRRGVGMVYSSEFLSAEAAEMKLRHYLQQSLPPASPEQERKDTLIGDLACRQLTLNTGVRQVFWVENCVAVGLAAGFIEPLEASAIALIETSANFICDNMPLRFGDMPIVARRFNQLMTYHWQRIADFLKLHYVLSQREDSEYWRVQRQLVGCSEWLRDNLQLWQSRGPNLHDASLSMEMFPAASWQYIWFGMQQGRLPFAPQPTTEIQAPHSIDQAQLAFQRVASRTRSLAQTLPSNRELLTHIRQQYNASNEHPKLRTEND